MTEVPEKVEPVAAEIHVAPAPHLFSRALTTRAMMIDVLIALAPVVGVSLYVFRWYAAVQMAIAVASALAAEGIFTALRRKPFSLGDCSAAVTGALLALSLPATAPWYAVVIGAFVGIGIGKVIFGGLGQNVFNPAMVGRAFVMMAFASALGAGGYVKENSSLDVLTQATPLTAAKEMGQRPALADLLRGTHNGSLGEVSAVACLAGGLYLCLRRTASWQIPLGMVLAVAVFGGLANWADPQAPLTVLHHLLGGATLFGAFFIATDPVTSPLTPWGKFIFGSGVGGLVILIRLFSGYPEGVMFSVLIMNCLVPMLNRWTAPVPVGGPTPRPDKKDQQEPK